MGICPRENSISSVVIKIICSRQKPYYFIKVNGQNVVGLKDTDISKIIDNGESVVTITIIPTFIYSHMIKK